MTSKVGDVGQPGGLRAGLSLHAPNTLPSAARDRSRRAGALAELAREAKAGEQPGRGGVLVTVDEIEIEIEIEVGDAGADWEPAVLDAALEAHPTRPSTLSRRG